MKKILRQAVQTGVCLFSLGMNPSLWASSPAEALEEERLVIGETSVLATSFVQTIWKLHQKKNAQVVLRDPKFLEGLSKLKNPKHYLPLISYMSPETKTYLNQDLFTLFPFSSFPTDNPALKIHEYLGASEQAQMTDTIQQINQITDTLEEQESTLLAALLSAGYKGPLDEEMFGILNLPSMPPILEVQDEIKMPEAVSEWQCWFSAQKDERSQIEAAMLSQQDRVQTIQNNSEESIEALATLNFLKKRLYAATHPTDLTLTEDFDDTLLFTNSSDLAHLYVSELFLTAASLRDQQKLMRYEPQYRFAEGNESRRQRLRIEMDTLMLKTQIMSSGSIVLGKISANRKHIPTDLLNQNLHLRQLFLEYLPFTQKRENADVQLPLFHLCLRKLTQEYDFDIPALLSTPQILEVQDDIKMPEAVITSTPVEPTRPVLTIETTFRELEDASQRLGALAIETQSIEMTHTVDGVMQALYFGRLAQEAVRNGNQKKAQEYFERLEHITKHLSEGE